MDIQPLINGLIAASCYLPLALAFCASYRLNRFYDVTPAAAHLIGMYSAWLCVRSLDVSGVVAVVLGACGASLFGLCAQFTLWERARVSARSSSEKFLISLGAFIVCQSLIAICFGESAIPYPWASSGTLRRGGLAITGAQAALLVFGLSCGTFFVLAEKLTELGREYRAACSNFELSVIVGVRTRLITRLTTAVGCWVAGGGGVLFGTDVGVTPTGSFRLTLGAIVAVIVGGSGSFEGAALGCVVVGLVQHLTAWWISSLWQDAMVYVLLVLFLVARPQGLLARK
jgi:branched-chain amino acid transport system permease protein